MRSPRPWPQVSARKLVDALAVYASARVGVVVLLGFSAGLPLALSAETLRVWMADRGVDVGTIGLISLASLPYTVKFLWAPVVDALEVPWLAARLGRRRGWLVASQLALMAAILLLAVQDPAAAPLAVGAAALTVAFASATQDIVIDAFRVESLSVEEQAAGMAGYVAAYRVGMLVSGAGVVALTAWLEARGWPKEAVWPIAYAGAALMVGVGLLAALLAREPATAVAEGGSGSLTARVLDTAAGAFRELLSRRAALGILVFVILYKLCDALAGAMTAPFVLTALGYDKATYAAIVKGLGLAALLAGGFAGGVVARALPLASALWLGVLLQMLSNLAFVWLWLQPPGAGVLAAAIVLENFAGAIGTVIFVAYISALCSNPLHTATQYALLTALASAGRTLLASGSGFMVDAMGWPLFFLATALAALPALALLTALQRRGHFAALDGDRRRARSAQL